MCRTYVNRKYNADGSNGLGVERLVDQGGNPKSGVRFTLSGFVLAPTGDLSG